MSYDPETDDGGRMPIDLARHLITRIQGQLEIIAADFPSYSAALNAAFVLDRPNGGNGHGSGPSDPTLAHVLARQSLTYEANDIIDTLERGLALMSHMRQVMGARARLANALEHEAIAKANRCSAQGHKGALEWSRPDCRANAVRGGLCWTCYGRERTWLSSRTLEHVG